LLLFKGSQRMGVEFKRADAPGVEVVPLWALLPK
jgi:hypothetical protein